MTEAETAQAKILITTSFEQPPVIPEPVLSCVHSISSSYMKKKYHTTIHKETVEIVLQSLAMYRQLIDIGSQEYERVIGRISNERTDTESNSRPIP